MADEKPDPTKPLRNRKHEKFCQELVRKPQATQAEIYKEIYPNSDDASAISHSSRLVANGNIRERVMALFEKAGAGLDAVSSRINDHMRGDNAPVSMDACKTILKVAGALDEQKQAEASYNPVQINIIIEGKDTQSTMPIDVTATDA